MNFEDFAARVLREDVETKKSPTQIKISALDDILMVDENGMKDTADNLRRMIRLWPERHNRSASSEAGTLFHLMDDPVEDFVWALSCLKAQGAEAEAVFREEVKLLGDALKTGETIETKHLALTEDEIKACLDDMSKGVTTELRLRYATRRVNNPYSDAMYKETPLTE